MLIFNTFFLTGLFIFTYTDTGAQSDSTLIQKIASDFCSEFSKKDFTTFKNSEVELGLIILPLIEKYSNEIQKEWGLNADDSGVLEKIGERIGKQAALSCPGFLEFIKNNLSEIRQASGQDEETMSGTFLRLDNQQFSSLLIKSKTGKEERLWWFQFFEGADDLLKNPANFVRKNITVRYVQMEVFDSKIKEYRSIKIIKSLAVN